MRLFLALVPKTEVSESLHEWAMEAFEGLPGRVIPAEDIHATLMFFGSRDEQESKAIIDLVSQVKFEPVEATTKGIKKMGRSSLAVQLEGDFEHLANRMGRASMTFPNDTPPQEALAWFKQWENDPLHNLAQFLKEPEIEKIRRRDRHGRKFELHITLFRTKDERISKPKIPLPTGELVLDRIVLFESLLKPGGSEYRVVAEALR